MQISICPAVCRVFFFAKLQVSCKASFVQRGSSPQKPDAYGAADFCMRRQYSGDVYKRQALKVESQVGKGTEFFVIFDREETDIS